MLANLVLNIHVYTKAKQLSQIREACKNAKCKNAMARAMSIVESHAVEVLTNFISSLSSGWYLVLD
jgi:hypothetical protein